MGLFGKNKKEDKKQKATFENNLAKYGFTITAKVIKGSWLELSVFRDDTHKKWATMYSKKDKPVIFDFSDFIGCDIIENGINQTKGNAGSALVGGALFGTVGAIAGASRAKKQEPYCNSMSLEVHTSIPEHRTISISIINSPTKVDSASYRISADYAKTLKEEFDYMLPPTTQTISGPSPADEIAKYKELMDTGAITADEYNAKKKQLLGL